MALDLSRNRIRLTVVLVLFCLSGCGPPAQPQYLKDRGFRQTGFKGVLVQSMRVRQNNIQIWYDDARGSALALYHPGKETALPPPADNRPGYGGQVGLPDGGVLSFRCFTEDGSQGTMTFTRDRRSVPEDGKSYQLSDGRLFLVTSKDKEIKVEQLDRKLPDDSNSTELESFVKSDPKISAFVAGAKPSNN